MAHDAARHRPSSRLRTWLPRRPAGGERVVAHPDGTADRPLDPTSAPDVAPTPEPANPGLPEFSALLADIDELRLMLSADLGLAASAVEVGAYDIAVDVLDGDRHDLAEFTERSVARLTGGAPDESAQPADEATVPVAFGMDVGAEGEPEADPAPAAHRLRRMLPVAPALAAAAAVIGLLAGVVPNPTTGSPGAATPMTNAAAASYAQLFRLHESGAPADRLRAAHRALHVEVARIAATAADDPQAAAQALRLLELEVQVLDSSEHRAELSDAMEESRRLVAVLRAMVSRSPLADLLADLPTTPEPEPAPRPASRPAGPQARSADEQTSDVGPSRRAEPTPNDSAAAQPQPQPASEPSSEASSAPEPEPAPAPESEPTPTEPEPASAPAPGVFFPTNGAGTVLPN